MDNIQEAMFLLKQAVDDVDRLLKELPLVTPPTMLAPVSPDLTREQVLKWCVENQPSFSNTRPDMLPPQGWFWQRSEDGVDKYLISENHKDTVFEVDVMVYVDPVDIVDPIMSREQAIEWCVENLIYFEKLAPGMKPPEGWGINYDRVTDTYSMCRDDATTSSVRQYDIQNHIDKSIASDVGLNRNEMIQWCKDNDVDFNTSNCQLPTGWKWVHALESTIVSTIVSTIHSTDVE